MSTQDLPSSNRVYPGLQIRKNKIVHPHKSFRFFLFKLEFLCTYLHEHVKLPGVFWQRLSHPPFRTSHSSISEILFEALIEKILNFENFKKSKNFINLKPDLRSETSNQFVDSHHCKRTGRFPSCFRRRHCCRCHLLANIRQYLCRIADQEPIRDRQDIRT